MERIEARCLDELLRSLRDVEDNVPRRGAGRTKQHTEAWVAKRLLASFASADKFRFPMTVEFSDKPDLIVTSDDVGIGIELTELVPDAYAQAVAIANQKFPSAIVDRSVFRWGRTWSPQEIQEHLRREGHRLSGPGWAGDSVEREWACAVHGAIEKKVERLNSPGFRTFSQNWLGTYASSPGPIFNSDVASKFLSASNLRCGTFRHHFDACGNLVSRCVILICGYGVRTLPCVEP